MEYRYVRLSRDRISDLAKLFLAVYGHKVDKDSLVRKFDTSVFGAGYIGFLAFAAGSEDPAAFYGVFPVRVRLNGKEYLAAQSGDTMTHPEHRGKGLFVELARRTYALAQESGIVFVFGYPNKNSYPGFVRKLGWKHPFDMIAWNSFLPVPPIARFVAGSRWRAPYMGYFRSVSRLFFTVCAPAELGDSFDDVVHDNAVCHGREFLQYKSVIGMVLIHRSARIWVKIDGDLCVGYAVDRSNGVDLRSAFRRLRVVALLTGIPRLKSYYSPGSRMEGYLKGSGFKGVATAYGYVSFRADIDPARLETAFVDYDTF